MFTLIYNQFDFIRLIGFENLGWLQITLLISMAI